MCRDEDFAGDIGHCTAKSFIAHTARLDLTFNHILAGNGELHIALGMLCCHVVSPRLRLTKSLEVIYASRAIKTMRRCHKSKMCNNKEKLLQSSCPPVIPALAFHLTSATWRSGDAAACKAVYPGSIPGVASKVFVS